MSEFENGTHTAWTSTDGHDIFWVFDGANDTGGKYKFFSCFANIGDVASVITVTPDVIDHGIVRVLGSGVDIGREHHGDVLLPVIMGESQVKSSA